MRSQIRFPLVPFPYDFSNVPESPRIPFLIEGFLPRGYLAILASTPKEGKTSLATALALSIASGTPFAGMQTRQAPVLWLSLEESPTERAVLLSQASAEVKSRLSSNSSLAGSKAVASNAEPKPSGPGPQRTLLYHAYATQPIDTPFGMADLEGAVAETGAGLIVIDPLHAATSGLSLYDASNARRALQELKTLCTRAEVTTLILHDIRERGQARPAESQQLSAIASMFLLLKWRQDLTERAENVPPMAKSITGDGLPQHIEKERLEDKEPSRIIELSYRGRGSFANGTIYLGSNGPLDYAPVNPARKSPDASMDPRKPVEEAIIAALLKGSKTVSELLPEVPATPSAVKNAVTRLYQSGIIEVRSIDSGVRKYGISRND